MLNTARSVLWESFRLELLQVLRARLFLALTLAQALTFLFLVSLFSLTGSQAPTALVAQDAGPYTRAFIAQLAATHHSFALRPMDSASAQLALNRGSLVAMIILPANFSVAISQGQPVTLRVEVDNVNTDLTDDIQRALPSAIVAFGRQQHFPNIRVQETELDLIRHDTGFIPYLVVSGLVLDAFIIASILSAMAIAREFETRTIKLLAVAPVPLLLPLLGRVLATNVIACLAMLLPVGIAILGYQIIPLHPLEMVGTLLLCIPIFGCIGMALGTLLKRTLPVVSLIFGLSFPLYLCSGSLEPQRFDGNLIWAIAHLSPVYYTVGLLEEAFHGLQVTPEAPQENLLVLLGWAGLALILASVLLRRALVEKSAPGRAIYKPEPGEPGRARSWNWRSGPALAGISFILVALGLLGLSGFYLHYNQQRYASIQLQQSVQQTQQNSSEDQRETYLLNGYMQNTTDMLTRKPQLYTQFNNPLRDPINTQARELLLQFDPMHKATLLRYLYTKKLIDDDYHIVSLRGTDFHNCNLAGINLEDTDLSGANFSDSDLRNGKLSSSTLVNVNFTNTNLMGADLRVTDMQGAIVQNTNLAGADLVGVVGISTRQLLQAHSLAGTRLPDGSVQPGEPLDND